jgi:GH15 family glucan-1,4-alpha-glucosidase
MALRIEDYAMIGDTESGALVGKNGSIDWFCAPRFDSPALFAALLGTEANGHWQIAPVGQVRRVERRYRRDTLVLETDFEMDGGAVRIVDCMPPREGSADIVLPGSTTAGSYRPWAASNRASLPSQGLTRCACAPRWTCV